MSEHSLKPSQRPDPDRIGFFGKLPTHGDFVSLGFPPEFERLLQEWLQEGLQLVRGTFGEGWERTLDSTPPWRFVVERGLWGSSTFAGVLVSSRDRVGRSFPLVIAAQLRDFDEDPRQLSLDESWFTAIEAIGETCQNRDFNIDAFKDNLKRLRRIRPADAHRVDDTAARGRYGETLWWAVRPGSRQVQKFRNEGAPRPADLLALICSPGEEAVDEKVEKPQEDVERTGLPQPEPYSSRLADPLDRGRSSSQKMTQHLRWKHAFATHAGTRLSINSDALIASSGSGLFAVADGLGDHPGAARAAKLAVNLLGEALSEAPLETRMQEVKGRLGRANSLLQSNRSIQRHATEDAASIATLLLSDRQFAMLWAGDTRCYLLRDGMMRCLSRDHVKIGMVYTLARAIGLAPTLSPEWITDECLEGDCFLLCSAPLVKCLSERSIAETLLQEGFQTAPMVLIENGLIAGCRDNMTALCVQVFNERG